MAQIDIKVPTVTKALADSKRGVARYEVSDSRAKGLTLRVGPGAVVWVYRFMMDKVAARLSLGSVETWSIAEARQLVSDAQVLIRGKIRRPDDVWVAEMLVAHGKVVAPVVAPVVDLPVAAAPTTWTWEEARTQFLDHILRTRREATWRDYKNRLAVPELSRFEGRAVASITRREMAVAVEDIHKRGVESQSEHVRDIVKSMWSHIMMDHLNEKSGVVLPVMVGLRSPERTKQGEVRQGAYVPPIEEIGRIMAMARSGALEPRVGYAIELLVFTCQRVTPVCRARRDGMNAIGGGRGIWSMSAAHRKTADKRGARADHTVPLPAQAWKVVKAAMALTEELDHERLFPGVRPQKASDEVGPLSSSSVQHNLSYLPGITATPHDIRRTFSNHGAIKFGWTLDQVKSVLDHNEGAESGDVTILHYAFDGMTGKWPVMTAWCNWVEEVTAATIAADKRLSDVEWVKAHVQKARAKAKGRETKGISLAKAA